MRRREEQGEEEGETSREDETEYLCSENGTQSAQAYALYLNLAPPSSIANVTSVLLSKIKSKEWNMHHSVGIFGMKFLLSALCETGNCDVAAQCINQVCGVPLQFLLSV